MPSSLGEFEQLLLLSLTRAKGEAHGGELGRLLEERAGKKASPGAIYTVMDRLESKGYVTSWLSDPVAARGGRSRKHYRLEPEGAVALSHSLERIKRMSKGLEKNIADLAARAQPDGRKR